MAARLAAKHKNKRPSLSTEPFVLFDAGNDGGRPARHPPGRCCATFKSAPGGFVPTPESAHRQTTNKTKGPVFRLSLLFYLMPGNSLLSHGETPHYHRRYGVSLLSSAWGQVGPPRSRRQANSLQVPNFNLKSGADTQSRTGDLTLTKGALYQLSHISTLNLMPWQFPTLTWGDPTLPSALRRFTSEFGMGSGGTTALSPPGKFCFTSPSYDALINLYHAAENHLKSPKQLRRCKVKPHGSLVSVSSTYRYAYTPDLSTSSSLTFLQET